MPVLRVKHIKRVTARRGAGLYWYHAITGERLPDEPEVRAARALAINDSLTRDAAQARAAAGAKPGSVAHAVALYRAAPEFKERASGTRRGRKLRGYGPFCFGLTPSIPERLRQQKTSFKLMSPEQPLRRLIMSKMDEVIAEIRAERLRQQLAEGWDEEHDDKHQDGQIAFAGSCYAAFAAECAEADALGLKAPPNTQPENWPWDSVWWKPKNPRRDLIRAAALLVAEIERLDRLKAKEKTDG